VREAINHFASVADIDEFVEVLRRYEAGEIDADAFRTFRLARGVYGQRQPDVQMIRVKVPGGLLTVPQLEALADVAADFSRGFGHITTRQNIQFHFVKLQETEGLLRRLEPVGLTTREACGNTVRNVTADPLTGLVADEAFDVLPYAEWCQRHLLRDPRFGALPRKFKIAFSANEQDRAQAAINDLGFVARIEHGQKGFKVLVAGGLSTSPVTAWVLHDFIPAHEMPIVAEAVAQIFDRVGNRANRARARLKYAVKKLGFEEFKVQYEATLEEIRARHPNGVDMPETSLETGTPPPNRPIPQAEPRPDFEAWRTHNVLAQKRPGHVTVLVNLLLGDLTAAQFRALARICETFTDGTLRTTNDQDVVLPWVAEAALPALHRALVEADLGRSHARTLHDATSCPGADSCNLAYTGSRDLGRELVQVMEKHQDRSSVKAALNGDIKISGCPNSCGQHHVAAIGFHGGIRRVGERVLPLYELHLGGQIGPEGARFGRRLGKVPARLAGEALIRLLDLYESHREAGERVADFFWRVDEKLVAERVDPLNEVAIDAPDEMFQDLGTERVFGVHLGAGECAS
jgi:sulfite reductase (NADPH) hemoprotein beta-component